MKNCFKGLFVVCALLLTSACQDTLDTSSIQSKEQSIKQMMVGIYPQNQKIFKNALNIIYDVDRKAHPKLTTVEVTALTNKKLNGKTVEDILRLSFISKKSKNRRNRVINVPNEPTATVVAVSKLPKLGTMLKVSTKTK